MNNDGFDKVLREKAVEQIDIYSDKSLPLSTRLEETALSYLSSLPAQCGQDEAMLALSTLHVRVVQDAVDALKEYEAIKKDMN